MKRTLMAIAAVSGLTMSTALAQAPMGSGAPPAGQAITQQSPDQWLATKFRGTSVVGTDDSRIGDVTDILFDKSGKVHAVIVGVGGFLGIGQKDVALPLSSFETIAGLEGRPDRLKLAMTKDQLQQMAEFKQLAPATTTGAAPPSRPAQPTPQQPSR